MHMVRLPDIHTDFVETSELKRTDNAFEYKVQYNHDSGLNCHNIWSNEGIVSRQRNSPRDTSRVGKELTQWELQ